MTQIRRHKKKWNNMIEHIFISRKLIRFKEKSNTQTFIEISNLKANAIATRLKRTSHMNEIIRFFFSSMLKCTPFVHCSLICFVFFSDSIFFPQIFLPVSLFLLCVSLSFQWTIQQLGTDYIVALHTGKKQRKKVHHSFTILNQYSTNQSHTFSEIIQFNRNTICLAIEK